MTHPFVSFARLTAGAWLACSLPLAALAAPSSDAAASQPTGPTVASDIATQCKQMSGDERTACERDRQFEEVTGDSSRPCAPAWDF